LVADLLVAVFFVPACFVARFAAGAFAAADFLPVAFLPVDFLVAVFVGVEALAAELDFLADFFAGLDFDVVAFLVAVPLTATDLAAPVLAAADRFAALEVDDFLAVFLTVVLLAVRAVDVVLVAAVTDFFAVVRLVVAGRPRVAPPRPRSAAPFSLKIRCTNPYDRPVESAMSRMLSPPS
jgi:hypothetical protein